jgi:hypothetical protein
MRRPDEDKLPAFSVDRSFPYVFLWSTFGTIVSLAAVWIMTAQAYAPALGA